jgi:hypothetical protein
MKIYFSKPNVNYKGEPQPQGTVLDVDNAQHQAALLSGGCKIYDPEIHNIKKPAPAKAKKVKTDEG